MKLVHVAAAGLTCLASVCFRPAHADDKNPTLLGTVPIAGTSYREIVYNSNNKKLYVTGNKDTSLLVVDPDAKTVDKTITLPFEGGPMAFNATANTIYVIGGVAKQLVRVNCSTDAVSAPVTVSSVYAAGIAYNPVTDRVYVTTYDANLRSYDGTSLANRLIFPLGSTLNPMPEGVAVNPRTNLIYCNLLGEDKVVVVNGNSARRVATIPVRGKLRGITCLPSLNRIYAVSDSGYVNVIDGATNTSIAETKVNSAVGGNAIALHPVGDGGAKRLFVGTNSNDIATIDLDTNLQIGGTSAARSS